MNKIISPFFFCCCLVLSPSCASLISPIRLMMTFLGLSERRFFGIYSDISYPFPCVAVLFVETCGSSGTCWDIFMCHLGFNVHSDMQENVAADQEEPKEPKSTSTPPSTPVRAEEGKLSCHTWHAQHALLVLDVSGLWLRFWSFLVCVRDVEFPGCPLACLFWDLFMWWCLIILLVLLCFL